MQIIIQYESSWRNSFLSGSNNEIISKTNERKFIASTKQLNDDPEKYIERRITKDTVMGVLNRLIGDQRKLYQSRQDKNYYFKNIEKALTDHHISDDIDSLSSEIVRVTNLIGDDPSSFSGMINLNEPLLMSNFSMDFWRVLWMSVDELLDFIINKNMSSDQDPILDPFSILERSEILKKVNIDATDKAKIAIEILRKNYEPFKIKENKNGTIQVLSIYCSALYLQLDLLSKTYDTSTVRASRGGIPGISHNNFTPKDFMKRFAKGNKKVWGNPYLSSIFEKGNGLISRKLRKASGKLTINLDISREEAKDLEEKINNAGVSTFYLGKKGLAYVSDIRI